MDIVASHQRWQSARNAELAGADSWLGIIGLFWLEPGINRVGSAADAVVRLPAGPAHLGELNWVGEQIFWQPVTGPASELQTDRSGPASTVDQENLSFFVVDRDNRLAVRLRDRDWAASKPFAGLAYFSYDPAWRIEAEWQALPSPLSMEVPNVSGDLKTVLVSHQAVFVVAGESVALLPMSVSDDEVFFVFRDRTSGKDSYGAGRFLKAPVPVDGKIVLDFNFAYSPPCAFTPFATCPLPPPENWLQFAVAAGEKKPPTV
jgi:uncharacterized protein (DUF1684 family)